MATPEDAPLSSIETDNFDWDAAAEELLRNPKTTEDTAAPPPAAPKVEQPTAKSPILIHLAALAGPPPDFTSVFKPARGHAAGGTVPSLGQQQDDDNPSWALDDEDDVPAAAEGPRSLADQAAPSTDAADSSNNDEDEDDVQPWVFSYGDSNDNAAAAPQQDDEPFDPMARLDRTAEPVRRPKPKGFVQKSSPSTAVATEASAGGDDGLLDDLVDNFDSGADDHGDTAPRTAAAPARPGAAPSAPGARPNGGNDDILSSLNADDLSSGDVDDEDLAGLDDLADDLGLDGGDDDWLEAANEAANILRDL